MNDDVEISLPPGCTTMRYGAISTGQTGPMMGHMVRLPDDTVAQGATPEEVAQKAWEHWSRISGISREDWLARQAALKAAGHASPVLHHWVPMGSRVKIPDHYHARSDEVWGVVQGVASAHVLWTYIVVLDAPLITPFGEVRAVAVPGPELEGEGGVHWRHTGIKARSA